MDTQQVARGRIGQRDMSSYGNARRRTGHGTAQHAPNDDHYVSLAVAADLVGVSVKTLRRRITAHVLPA